MGRTDEIQMCTVSAMLLLFSIIYSLEVGIFRTSKSNLFGNQITPVLYVYDQTTCWIELYNLRRHILWTNVACRLRSALLNKWFSILLLCSVRKYTPFSSGTSGSQSQHSYMESVVIHYDSGLMCNSVLWFNSIFFIASLFINVVGASRQETLIKEWKGQRKKHSSTGFIHSFLLFNLQTDLSTQKHGSFWQNTNMKAVFHTWLYT